MMCCCFSSPNKSSMVSYHIATPLSLCCTCAPEVLNFILNLVFEFIVKGKNQMPAIETDWWESVNIVLMKLGWLQWIGSAIFLWGWIHQFHHHAFLVSQFHEALGGL